ncbi:MAG: hypothetical protein HF978_06470 [Desulfobacteraceae bacterium]|nr:hypothetical protein [Desulfobacteraceae bacterium]MBC2755175.1 hypothetical protein [Desulfobacteraceae bacterium]
MDEWKTIEPGVWKPIKPGENIVGVLVNKQPKDENTGMSARYYLENERGTFFAWGSTVLDDRMQYVKVGQKIRITFEGKTKNKRGQDVNLFKVEASDTQPRLRENNESEISSRNNDSIPIEDIEGI